MHTMTEQRYEIHRSQVAERIKQMSHTDRTKLWRELASHGTQQQIAAASTIINDPNRKTAWLSPQELCDALLAVLAPEPKHADEYAEFSGRMLPVESQLFDRLIRPTITLDTDGGTFLIAAPDGTLLALVIVACFNDHYSIDILPPDDRQVEAAAWQDGRSVMRESLPTGVGLAAIVRKGANL